MNSTEINKLNNCGVLTLHTAIYFTCVAQDNCHLCLATVGLRVPMGPMSQSETNCHAVRLIIHGMFVLT